MQQVWAALLIGAAFIVIMIATAGLVRGCHREAVSVANAIPLYGCPTNKIPR